MGTGGGSGPATVGAFVHVGGSGAGRKCGNGLLRRGCGLRAGCAARRQPVAVSAWQRREGRPREYRRWRGVVAGVACAWPPRRCHGGAAGGGLRRGLLDGNGGWLRGGNVLMHDGRGAGRHDGNAGPGNATVLCRYVGMQQGRDSPGESLPTAMTTAPAGVVPLLGTSSWSSSLWRYFSG